MTLVVKIFDAGPEGGALTTGNAGLAQVTLGGGTALYRAAAALDGAFGCRLTSVAAGTSVLRASLNASNDLVAIEFGFTCVTEGANANDEFFNLRWSGGISLRLAWASAANQIVVDGGTVTGYQLVQGSLVVGTKYRVAVTVNRTTAAVDVYLYPGNSTTSSAHFTSSALTIPANAFSQLDLKAGNGAVYDFDSLQMNDGTTTVIGPYAPPANVNPTVYGADGVTALADIDALAGTNITLTGRLKDSDGTIASAQWEYRDDDTDGAFTSSTWTALTTSTSNLNTADTTATATDTAVPAGVRQYRLRGTDNAGGSINDTLEAYVYPVTGTHAAVRAITGAWTNAGPNAAATAQQSVNDALDGSYVESAAGPVAAVSTILWDPINPVNDVVLPLRLQADASSPTVPVQVTTYKADGTTQLYQTSITPTVTATTTDVKFDSTANTAATVRRALVTKLSATTN